MRQLHHRGTSVKNLPKVVRWQQILTLNTQLCVVTSDFHVSCHYVHRPNVTSLTPLFSLQAFQREPEGFRRRLARPQQNWKWIVKKDLRKMDISWDEVEETAEDRRSWWNRVAQCVLDAGWTTNQGPLFKGSDMPTKVGLYWHMGSVLPTCPSCQHQWLIWLAVGVEPTFTGSPWPLSRGCFLCHASRPVWSLIFMHLIIWDDKTGLCEWCWQDGMNQLSVEDIDKLLHFMNKHQLSER